MKHLFYLWLLIFLSCNLFSQQSGTFSQYIFNRGIINPAYPGTKACTEFFFTDRHQLVGFGGAPSLQTLSAYHSFSAKKLSKSGIGMNLLNDMNGAYKTLAGEAMYAFHFLISRKHNLMMGFGLSGIIRQEILDEHNFSPIPDPIVSGGVERQLMGNAATGVEIYNDHFFISAAAYNLIPGITQREQRAYLFHAGYNVGSPKKKFKFQPSVFFESNRRMNISDLTQKFIYKEKYWLGLQFRKYLTGYARSSQNLTVFVGIDMNAWIIGYAFELGINQLQSHHFGGHLLTIGYQLCKERFSCPAY
mgnify:CR=1 FL=1